MENQRPWPSDGLLEDGQEHKFSSLLANLIVQAHTLHVLKMHIFFDGTHSQKIAYFPYAGRVFLVLYFSECAAEAQNAAGVVSECPA